MNGSVTRREDKPPAKCRTWQLRVDIGTDSTGKRIRKSKTYHGCERDAKRALKEWISELEQAPPDPPQHNFAECCDEFMEWKIYAKRIGDKTITTNRACLENLKLHFGFRSISSITDMDILRAFNAMRNGQSASGKHLTETTLNKVFIIMKELYNFCIKRGYVTTSPLVDIKAPRPDTKRRQALTTDQAWKLTEQLTPDNMHHVSLMLMLHAGLRVSETLTLTWSDVDLNRHLLHVHGTKTEASEAVLPLSNTLCEYLLAWKQNQALNGLIVADMDNPHGIAKDGMCRWWARNKHRYGCTNTLHEFRHTFVSMLALNGIHPATMARLARHADCRTTLDIYTHVNMADCEQAVEKLDAFWEQNGSKEVQELKKVKAFLL